MSGINTPFPVDSIVLGEVVSHIFNPSPLPPNCFAQGILTKHGHLDPIVPAHVVKIEAGAGEASAASAAGTAGASLRVFALHGNFSVAGVAALPAYPATALSATFSRDGRVSNAVFGNIDRVDESNVIIHTLHGIRASFSPANGRCTKVCIDDTYWMPWTPHDCTTIKTDIQKPDETPSFHHDFTTGETYVSVRKFGKICVHSGARFEQMVEHPDPGFTYKIVLKSNKEMVVKMPNAGAYSHMTTVSTVSSIPTDSPSEAGIARGKQFLLKCDEILQSKMKAIKWLETHHRIDEPSLVNIFGWMNGFIAAQPRPHIQHSLSLSTNFLTSPSAPAVSSSVWSGLMYDSRVPNSKSGRLVRPCKCTPTEKDPQCRNEFCNSKLAIDHSIILQDGLKQAILQRFDAKLKEKESAEAAVVAAAATKKLETAAKKLADKQQQLELTAIRQEEMRKRAAAKAAAAAGKPVPVNKSASVKPVPVKPAAAPGAAAKPAPQSSASSVKPPITKKKGGSKSKSKSKSKRRLRK